MIQSKFSPWASPSLQLSKAIQGNYIMLRLIQVTNATNSPLPSDNKAQGKEQSINRSRAAATFHDLSPSLSEWR
jgi:hypothetical protein